MTMEIAAERVLSSVGFVRLAVRQNYGRQERRGKRRERFLGLSCNTLTDSFQLVDV